MLELKAPETPVPPKPQCTVPQGMIPPLDETVRRAVLDAVDKCDGNVMLAAKCLGVGKTTLYRYLRLWGWISPYRKAAALIREPGDNGPTTSVETPAVENAADVRKAPPASFLPAIFPIPTLRAKTEL
jgi:hypothetical protein